MLEKLCPRCHKPLTFISGYSEGRDDNQGQRRRMRRPKPRRFRGESDGDDRKERSLVTPNYFQTNEFRTQLNGGEKSHNSLYHQRLIVLPL